MNRRDELTLILFDCDGTLVDSAFVIHDCMVATFEAFSYQAPDLVATKSIIGLSLDVAIAHLLHKNIDDEVLAMVAAYKRHFMVCRNDPLFDEPLFDGIKDMLGRLLQIDHYILGMVTGKSRRGVDSICQRHHLQCFVTVRTADDCPSKPDPTMVLECCEETGIVPSCCYVIGDSVYDMQMAVSAGATAVGVSWGYHSGQALLKSGADFILEKPDDLITYIEAKRHA